MDTDRAFVSSRLPVGLRDRLKTFAAARGESVQTVVERAVTRLLDEEAREPPMLNAVLRRLRDAEDALRQEGVTALWVFGSVARGDAGPDSDVDLAVELDGKRQVSLFTLGRLQTLAESILGTKVDLGIRSDLRPHVAQAFVRDAVQVL
jgi:predicted nucleotidyltransferase